MKYTNMKIILFILALSLMAVAHAQKSADDNSMPQPTLYGQANTIDDNSSMNSDKPVPALIQEQTQEQNQERAQEMMQEKAQIRSMTKDDSDNIRKTMQEQERIMQEDMTGKTDAEKKALQNQNPIRLAVHALLAMENRTGGIGRQISEIAKEFNNSIQSTINAEEKIEMRSSFKRFFAGGDAGAADELEQETVKNQARIQIMNQLKEQCTESTDCSQEAKMMLEEQIQTMQQEQTRLKALADKEKKSKGMFGWLWK